MKRRSWQTGFTLVEVMIVMALIGFLTLLVVSGSGQNIKDERFSGELRQFTDFIRQAQVKSTTTQTGTGCAVSTPAPGGNAGSTCFWRGTAINFAVAPVNTALQRQLLSGADLSEYSGFTDPKTGLYSETADTASTYTPGSLYISKLNVGGTDLPAGSIAAVAFLAPSGQAYVCTGSTATCTPTTANPQPFSDGTSVVIITLKDAATSLTGTVTFDPASGTISTKVQ